MGIGVGWYLLEGGCLLLGCWLWTVSSSDLILAVSTFVFLNEQIGLSVCRHDFQNACTPAGSIYGVGLMRCGMFLWCFPLQRMSLAC